MSTKICIGGPLDGVFVGINATNFECWTKHHVGLGRNSNWSSEIIEVISNYRLFEFVEKSQNPPYNNVFRYCYLHESKQDSDGFEYFRKKAHEDCFGS